MTLYDQNAKRAFAQSSARSFGAHYKKPPSGREVARPKGETEGDRRSARSYQKHRFFDITTIRMLLPSRASVSPVTPPSRREAYQSLARGGSVMPGRGVWFDKKPEYHFALPFCESRPLHRRGGASAPPAEVGQALCPILYRLCCKANCFSVCLLFRARLKQRPYRR